MLHLPMMQALVSHTKGRFTLQASRAQGYWLAALLATQAQVPEAPVGWSAAQLPTTKSTLSPSDQNPS